MQFGWNLVGRQLFGKNNIEWVWDSYGYSFIYYHYPNHCPSHWWSRQRERRPSSSSTGPYDFFPTARAAFTGIQTCFNEEKQPRRRWETISLIPFNYQIDCFRGFFSMQTTKNEPKPSLSLSISLTLSSSDWLLLLLRCEMRKCRRMIFLVRFCFLVFLSFFLFSFFFLILFVDLLLAGEDRRL